MQARNNPSAGLLFILKVLTLRMSFSSQTRKIYGFPLFAFNGEVYQAQHHGVYSTVQTASCDVHGDSLV